ncbi:hypothetical protein STAQ_30840 [Allostella sp. ATCC 35155]|nr:hypothetical protein STAQ_30840 [Stella sp. ATCC 35155]
MTVELAVAAVVAPGGPPLAPWLDFHRRLGVARFHLYRTGEADIVGAPDVTIIDWPFARPHRPAWDHCLFHHGPAAEWLALLEPDEYLFATDGTDLPTALAEFRDAPAVGVARLIYAPDPAAAVPWQAVRRAPASLVLALPTFLAAPGRNPAEHGSYRPLSARAGFVVRPDRTWAATGRHGFAFRDGAAAVDENGRPLADGWADPPSHLRLRINQYLGTVGETLPTRLTEAAPVRARASEADLEPFRAEIDTAILPIAAAGDVASCKPGA